MLIRKRPEPKAMQYSIMDFALDAERSVRQSSSEAETLRGIKPNLERLLESKIPKEAFIPRSDKYAMNLVYKPEDRIFSVVAGVWQPGQTTPIHDHLTWALVGIYEGKENESIYRRYDERRDEKIAKLEKVSSKTNTKGHVTVLGEAGIHRVSNDFDTPAFSIHIYGKDIGGVERHSYDPLTGSISTFKSGYCNVLRDLDDV
ncbi:MAG: cysteine dioxygenase family protein [Nitrososphaerota archaeon]|nr:cysteine dioxygenase family protein [Nitrososphaerota archaeon]